MRCIRFVEENPARYVFLATGAPRSEALAARIAARGLAVGTGLPIGSSLHFVAGLRRRAPGWVQRLGLEWLHRLALEPRRLWRRVFVDSLPVLRLAAPAIAQRLLRIAPAQDRTAP
jgi:exopolysaccharide biosynthesis WecB/TagA/CpsF family protein